MTDYTLTCDNGSFMLTWQDAGVLAARKITLSYGYYIYYGDDLSLLLDEFPGTLAAGFINGTYAILGPGTRAVTDTNSKISIGSGVLNFATGAAANDGIWYDLFARTPGRMLFAQITPADTAGIIAFGWDTDQAGAINDALLFSTTTGLKIVPNGGTAITVGEYIDEPYLVLAITRATGIYWFIKGGIYLNWTYLFSTAAGTANVYPAITAQNTTSVFSVDNVRIPDELWLPEPLASDGFSGATTDGLGHPEGVIGGLGAGGSGKTWVGSTWTVASGTITNTPGVTGATLAVDGDMEAANMDAWTTVGTPVSVAKDTTIKHGGAQSIKIVADANIEGVKQSVVFPANHWYKVSAWIYGDSGARGINFFINGVQVAFTRASAWLEAWGLVRGGVTYEIEFHARDGAGGTIYVDDLVVQQLDDANLFHTIDLATANVTASVKLPVFPTDTYYWSGRSGIALRLDSTSNPQNYIEVIQSSRSDDKRIHVFDVIGGVNQTDIINVLHTWAADDVLTVSLNGRDIRLYLTNAAGTTTLIGSGATNVLTGNLHGLYSTGKNSPGTLPTFDNFVVYATGNGGEYES